MKKAFLAVLMSIVALPAISQTHFDKYFIPDSSCGNVNLNQDSIHQHLLSGASYIDHYSNGNDYVFHTLLGFSRNIINRQSWCYCSTGLIQQFQTDNGLVVRGIAAYIISKQNTVPCLNCTFDLRDANHNVIDSLRWDTIANFFTYNTGGGWYEFMFSQDYKIDPGVFGLGISTEYPLNVVNPYIRLLGCKTDSYTSPLPILGIWEDSILPISSSTMYSDNFVSGGAYPNLICYSTLFVFPILAWQDTIPQDTSSLQNAQIEQYSYLYPNPAQEEITIACSFKIQTIEVYNITGQRVEERKVNSYTTKLNTQSYSKGAYTCKIKTDNGFAVKKFVVR